MRASSALFLAAAAAICVSPVLAQETQDPQLAALAAQKALYEAEEAKYKAQNEMMAARVKPLSDLAGEGNVTLGTGAGEMEAWLLSASAIGDAAALIADDIGRSEPVLLLAAGDPLNFQPLVAMNLEIDSIAQQLNVARKQAGNCGAPRRGTRLNAAPILPMIGALGSMLRSDTEIRGINVEADDRLLVMALARELGQKAIMPAAAIYPDAVESPVMNKLAQLAESRAAADALKVCLPPARKDAIAALTAAITRHDTFRTAISSSDAQGRVKLAEALALESVSINNPKVVRVKLEKSGGTMITRKNLWTALGARAVAVTGGVIATFWKTDPEKGSILNAGVVTCRTALKSIRGVHNQKGKSPRTCRLVEV
jgi:hypothetical protein